MSIDADHSSAPAGGSRRVRATRGRALRDVFRYAFARLVLLAVLTGVLLVVSMLIGAAVPVPVLFVLALIIAMPAAVFVFPRLRAEANEGMAEWAEQRRAHKAYVRAELAERELE